MRSSKNLATFDKLRVTQMDRKITCNIFNVLAKARSSFSFLRFFFLTKEKSDAQK